MDDLISRAAAMRAFSGKPGEYYHPRYIVGELKDLPAVDAAPVVHGRWGESAECSVCGFQPWYEHDIHTLTYCPHCGAKMDGDT